MHLSWFAKKKKEHRVSYCAWVHLEKAKESVSKLPPPKQEKPTYHLITTPSGKFWRRDKVKWKESPDILGKSSSKNPLLIFVRKLKFPFSTTQGTLLYMERANSIGQRFPARTKDAGKQWNRFSWFGFLPFVEFFKSSGQARMRSIGFLVDLFGGF